MTTTYRFFRESIGADLNAYASGDGSISFVWSRFGTATGEPVTPTHVSLWQKEFNRFTTLKIMNTKGGVKLYNPVTRIDGNTLVMNNRIYTYKKDESVTACDLYTVFDKEDSLPFSDGNVTAMQINFFLRNEQEILRQEREGLY